MVCRYCGASNLEDDHRCQRCGRRLHGESARPAPDLYPVRGAGALAPRPAAGAAPEARPAEPNQPASRQPPHQPKLFSTRDIGRVVPIRPSPDKTEGGSRKNTRRGSESSPLVTMQQSFPFSSAPTSRRQVGAEAVRYSNAPVAVRTHRSMAAALDFSMIAIALGLVMAIAHFMAGEELVNSGTFPYFLGVGVFFGMGYKLMWALADTDSPGVKWTHLCLLNFDGFPPTRAQRLQRIAAACLSLLAGTLGLLWALVDEETLSWHDHMSKTFLTLSSGREI